MSIHTRARRRLLAGAAAAIAVAGLPVAAQAHPAHRMAREQRAAAIVSTSAANAMQAAIAARGTANAVLANPYIEQKVTTPESVGVNRTRIPAGGF